MPIIDDIQVALDECEIARRVTLRHDEARMRYQLRRLMPRTFAEYLSELGTYYNYHFAHAISNGGQLPPFEAEERGREIVERRLRRQGSDIMGAYDDARQALHGGLPSHLNLIAEELKTESVERFIRSVLDHYLDPTDWDRKLEVTRQLLQRCGAGVAPSASGNDIARYAHNVQELARVYTQGLQQTAAALRRM